jgi:hypothetical protein
MLYDETAVLFEERADGARQDVNRSIRDESMDVEAPSQNRVRKKQCEAQSERNKRMVFHEVVRTSPNRTNDIANSSDTSPTCFDSRSSSPRLRHPSPHNKWDRGQASGVASLILQSLIMLLGSQQTVTAEGRSHWWLTPHATALGRPVKPGWQQSSHARQSVAATSRSTVP